MAVKPDVVLLDWMMPRMSGVEVCRSLRANPDFNSIAVVLLTAGYSADGKYSHYLIVQSPMTMDGIRLNPGEYVFGYSRDGDTLSVRLYEALTGKPVGTAKAVRVPGSTMVRSLHILPPSEKPFIQIGRFGIPYELGDK